MTWEGRLEPGQDLEGLCITVFEFARIFKDSAEFTVILRVKHGELWRCQQSYRGHVKERNAAFSCAAWGSWKSLGNARVLCDLKEPH